MKKYTKLFKQFDKLDIFTNMICKNIVETTKEIYPSPNTLLNFNEKR